MSIKEWLDTNLLDYTFKSNTEFEIKGVGTFCVTEETDQVFDADMKLVLSDSEYESDCDFYCYKFGRNYYYQPSSQLKLKQFNILKYLGKAKKQSHFEIPFLGVHGGFDLLNGSRNYKDWVTKAKFIGVNVLGICEKNTLAGTLKFQLACKSSGITPIIGAQYTIKDGEDLSQIKCYIKDERGWESLLLINKEVNVVNSGFITLRRFLELTEGLIIVLDPKYLSYDKTTPYFLNVYQGDIFWQLDNVEFDNNEKDKEFLLNTGKYIKGVDIPPIIITDAYYLDESESRAKEILNTISDKRDFKSSNQYFKGVDAIIDSLGLLFSDEEKFYTILEKAIKNTEKVAKRCQFNIPTGVRLLPEYPMTSEELKVYGTKENMFISLIQEGLMRKIKEDDIEPYLNQIEEEYSVIAGNDYIDYFLILWDIIKWSRENDILVGLGRGSAGGSLIAYLLDVIQIDPLKFGLLFERFLNHGRASKSYPDIDTDFEALRREDVKRYMEHRYGEDRVCSVGTYTNLKLKQSFKDLSKIHNVTFTEANYISQIFDIEEGDWLDLFKTAVNKSRVKDFILKHPEVIEDMRLILNQPKSRSIHACATVIVPEEKDIYLSIPVRKDMKGGNEIIVSEWEGGELESAGYLKEDILGVKQLDKYRFILNLIKENYGKNIDIYNVPLDDYEVIEKFQKGENGDVFHFGSHGLTGYCKQLKPENIHDLIAAISLYRPGAMEVNSHNEYVYRKKGEKSVEYRFMMDKITEETYGLIVYQEQVMKVFQVLADFSLSEADDIRRAIVKKKKELITDNKDFFIKKCVEKGCSPEEAKEIWHEVEVHAGYSFNKSHAAVYAITGYIGQWLKHYYPLQFWTAAFQFDDSDPKKSDINRYISEINKTNNGIRLRPPHINESGEFFTSNVNKNEIYWSLGKVDQVGEKSLSCIIEERNKNGQFFSLKEFLSRVNKRIVNKSVVTNLIVSGAFDEIENIEHIEDRRLLVKQYYTIQGIKDDLGDYNSINPVHWQMMQKEKCGYGEVDYKYIIKNHTDFDHYDFIDGVDLQNGEYERATVVVAGVVTRIKERSSTKAGDYANIEIECNHEVIHLTLWSDTWVNVSGKLKEKNIIVFRGMVKYDTYKGVYGMQSDEDTEIFII